MNPTVALYHDTRRAKKNSKYPVKLIVTFQRKQHPYPFGKKYDLTKEQFEAVFNPKHKGEIKKIHDHFISERKRAEEIIETLGKKFSFALFDKLFCQPQKNTRNVFQLLKERGERLWKDNQISTAVLTECTLSNLKKFHAYPELDLEEIDVVFLNKYEKWLQEDEGIYQAEDGKWKQKRQCSVTTVSMYIRNLQTVYNEAISNGLIAKEITPFGDSKGHYQIPVGKNIKKALTHAEVGLIFNYQPENEAEEKARDLWVFSYLANGINIKDIALLKFKNLRGDRIFLERAKTKKSNKTSPKIIEIVVSDHLRKIISKWGNKSIYEGNYIFPILSNNATAEEQYYMVYNCVKTINKYMKRIGAKLGIKGDVRTYVARHSFATVLKNAGKSTEFIKESLAHSNIKTTENYLGSFEQKSKEEAAAILTDFPVVKIV